MLELVGILLLTVAVAALSIFLLGLGSLLRRRCTLRPCGEEGPIGDACNGCPRARQPEPAEPAPTLEV